MLDCRSLDYELIRMPDGLRLLVCDTGVRRALASSEYNRRREECDTGVRRLSARIAGKEPIAALRDVSYTQLMEHGDALDPVVLRRCKHVITENDRVVRSADALRRGDLSEFGKLMYDSHLSLRLDYEVSCKELDAVVDICAETEGVYGARMTGAGFGGCVVCLVSDRAAEAVIDRLKAEYPRMSGKNPSVYVCAVDSGAASRRL
jgi:galactokinase